MSLSSKNPGHWRTSKTGSLNAHHMTISSAHSGATADGALELSKVTDNPAKHRRTRHKPQPISKNARRKAARIHGPKGLGL